MGRFIAAIWMLLGLLLATYFTGVVTSQMTVMLSEKVIRGMDDIQAITSVRILSTAIPATTWRTNTTIIPHLERAGLRDYDECDWEECTRLLRDGIVDAVVGDFPTLMYRIGLDSDRNLRVVGPRNDRASEPDGIMYSLVLMVTRDSPFALS